MSNVVAVAKALNIRPELVEQACASNRAFARIITGELPAVIELMASKSLDYKEHAQNLGVAGQFADMNRKWGKLERAMWHGEPLVGPEKLPEVLMDMIGHCLLTLDMLSQGMEGGR